MKKALVIIALSISIVACNKPAEVKEVKTAYIDTSELMKEYTDDFALTQLNNAHSFDNNSSIRFIEKFKARSHFLNFVRETIEDGRKASFDLNDGKEQF